MAANPKYQDENYHFKPGNPGGPGPRTRTREAEIYQMLLDIFDEPTRIAMVEAFQKRLANGETAPWREIAKYLLPTVQRTEHTGLDGAPLFQLNDIVSALQSMDRGKDGSE